MCGNAISVTTVGVKSIRKTQAPKPEGRGDLWPRMQFFNSKEANGQTTFKSRKIRLQIFENELERERFVAAERR